MTLHNLLPALFLAITPTAAQAATLRVGPGEQIARIADAAKLAKDGDTVEILPGEYRGDVAVWRQKALAISGSRFHDGFLGHLITSRARINDIRYNLTARPGGFTLAARGDSHDNLPAPPNLLAVPNILDFSLPIGTRPLAPSMRWVPGAVQTQ